MELNDGHEHFVKLVKIIIEVLPKHLRTLFVDKWNTKYPTQQWTHDAASGQLLHNEIPQGVKKNKRSFHNTLEQMILTGDIETWDPTALFFVLLFAGLNLTGACRPKKQRNPPFTESENIDRLREIRNTFFAHVPNKSISAVDFGNISTELKAIAKDVFGNTAEKEIDEIVTSEIVTILSEQSKSQLEKEDQINQEFWKSVQEPITDEQMQMGDNLQVRREEERNVASSVQDQPKPITDEEMGKVKERYKTFCGKHEIHTVKGKKVELIEVPVHSFAVPPKIMPQSQPETSFHDEMRRNLDNLSHSTDDQIDIDQLIEEQSRVTFIRGIAGMGKSVLAKQLALKWAKGEAYQEFKCCIMIECRDINYIRSTKGKNWEKHEIFDKVLKEQFNYDLGDGKGIFFILDGVDQLFDIHEDNSIIGQLLHLGRSKYEMSKIIITGRPNIENKLAKQGHAMGGLRRVEIQGLVKEQIDKYIDNFLSIQGDISHIRALRESSTLFLSLLCVPQFLNAFCCVAILNEGKEIENEAELYSWTLYLMLRQHGSESPNEERFPKCFERYSKLLQLISKICHELLNECKVIIERRIKDEIKEMIPVIKEEENFINGLFVDASDNEREMYQFKHLSLMEFLAALHICSNISKWEDTIKEYLKKGHIEVASHFCRLIGGISSSSIIRVLLEKVSKLTDFDKKLFLKNIITILIESEIDEETKFKRSIDFIAYLATKEIKCKGEILSMISTLHYSTLFLSDTSDLVLLRSISHTCNHLTKECGCTDEEIRKAFENFHIDKLDVQEMENLESIKHLNVSRIILRKTGVSGIQSILKDGVLGGCQSLSVVGCNLVDDPERKSNIKRQNSVKMLNRFGISRCALTRESFNDVCELGLVSEKFFLRDLKIENDWWMILVGKILEQKGKGSLQLKELYIEFCSTTLTEEMESLIAQCHVLVKSSHQSTETQPSLLKSRKAKSIIGDKLEVKQRSLFISRKGKCIIRDKLEVMNMSP